MGTIVKRASDYNPKSTTQKGTVYPGIEGVESIKENIHSWHLMVTSSADTDVDNLEDYLDEGMYNVVARNSSTGALAAAGVLSYVGTSTSFTGVNVGATHTTDNSLNVDVNSGNLRFENELGATVDIWIAKVS